MKRLDITTFLFILIQSVSNISSLGPEPRIPTSSTTSTTVSPPFGKIWALLVAGSNGYDNYRHQADVCHAYQLLKKNNLPAENIIVMMADDIANSSSNPTPGVIINKPNGSDVYKGVSKDYTGDNVKPELFLNILKGNKEAMNGIGSGRVIDSGPNDIIFVNFVDHGSPGALCFIDDNLYAKDLYSTLKWMTDNKKFYKMILYIEACYSGSVFDNILDDDWNIFVMTAADPNESSYACYYDNERHTYLGDVFSVNWMEIAEEVSEISGKSLNHLFEKVRTKTSTSHVEEYGDLDIGNTILSTVIKGKRRGRYHYYSNIDSGVEMDDVVKSEDVPLALLKKKMKQAQRENDDVSMKRYMKELRLIDKERRTIDKIAGKILRHSVKGDEEKIRKLKYMKVKINKDNMDCFAELSRAFDESCFKISKYPYVGKVLGPILNTCNLESATVDEVKETIQFVCSNYI